jgi:hypothetical protein
MLLQGLGGIEDIVTKAISVLGLVRTEWGQSLPVRSVSLLQQLPKSLGYGHQRVKGEQVCNEVIVFDKLPLLVANILGNHAVATEAHTHCTNLLNASLLLVAA